MIKTSHTAWTPPFLVLCVLVFILASPLFPQTGTGVVRGTAADANRAMIPGAEVTLTNLSTNVSQKSITNDVGIYYFGSVPRGRYSLTVQLSGFKTWKTDFELQTGETLAVDARLEIGEISTTVEVRDVAPVITTETTEVADVKNFERIQQLPLNGRSVSSLFDLTPGVEGGGNARVIGQKVGSLQITLDGISIVDRFGGGILRAQPSLDTVQEFRIETVGSDARYSRPANVTLVTRSGTNEFHGSVFETHRNNWSFMRSRMRQETGEAAKLIRNEYGVNAGGPVWLGRLYDGRDKTFWFASYEGYRLRQETVAVGSVPSDSMWAGDLSNLTDASGNFTTIYDPLTTGPDGLRQPFPNNIIPANRISSFAKLMQTLTHPATSTTNPVIGDNLTTAYPRKTDQDKLSLKFNHAFSQSDQVSVRWSRDVNFYAQEGNVYGYPSKSEPGLGTGRSDTEVNNVAVNHNHTFSPTFLNDLLVGANRSAKSSGTLADFTNFGEKLGMPNPFGVTGWPTMYAGDFGWDSDNRKDEMLTRATIEDNMTWIRGEHTIQFGGQFSREHNNIRELQQAQGSHDFGGSWTALYDTVGDQAVSRTGYGFADLLLGLPDYLSNQYNRGYFYFRNSEIGLYVMDKWKVTPHLTLQLGLRWEKWTPFTEAQNRLAAIDPDTVYDKFQVVTPTGHPMRELSGIPPAVLDSWEIRGLSWVTADQVNMPDGLFSADNNNFGPRLGAAYRLNDKTVLRGSYGEYFWPMPLSQILQTSRTQPPLNLRFENQPGLTDGTGSWTLRNTPSAQHFAGNVKVVAEGLVPLPSSARPGFIWDAKNWRDARSQAWNLTLERVMFKDTAVRLSYIGNHGSDLEQRVAINNREEEYNYVERTKLAPPSNRDLLRRNKDWALNSLLNRTGYSNTHSGQVEVERRYADGLAFQWFYTFTRSMTTTDAGGFTSGNGAINGTGSDRMVPENIQIMGNPNLSYEEGLKLIYFNSTNVPAHRIRYNAIVDLPFGRGRKYLADSPWMNHFVGGWQVALIGDWRGGMWSSLDASRRMFASIDEIMLDPDERLLVTFAGKTQRLWFRGDLDPTKVTGADVTSLIPVDCTQRPFRQQGPKCNNQLPQVLANGSTRNTSVGGMFNPDRRAFFRGPGAWNVDFSLFKHFLVREDMTVRLTADFFNLFNHPLDGSPSASTGLQDLSVQTNEPRTIQFSLRFNW